MTRLRSSRPSDRHRRPGTPGSTAEDRDQLGGLPLLEEAFHLLRRTPAELFVVFYAGSVPFVLYLLYFVADRIQTGETGVGAAGVAALLYCVMKVAQARFAGALRAGLGPAADVPSPWGRAFTQIESQPASLLVVPTALLIALPFGWVYAYYQGLAVTGDRSAARRHARAWPRQNHSLLALLALCSALVFANAVVTLLVLPALLHALLGVQSAATTHPLGMFSSTTAAVAAALTYLTVAPLTRAAYALRCFYFDARRSGDDLRGELRSARSAAVAAGPVAALAALVPLLAALCAAAPAGAQVAGEPAPLATVPDVSHRAQETQAAEAADSSAGARQLDEAIAKVLERREFAWRLPRARAATSSGFLASLTRPIVDATRRSAAWIADKTSVFMKWLRERLRVREPDLPRSPGGFDGLGWAGLLVAFVAVLAVAGTILRLRHRRRPANVATAQREGALEPAIAALMADDVAAAALPSDQWLAAARELLSQGDARAAVRAAYLATLALLAHERLVTPSRFKSNFDYQRELGRRARNLPGMAVLFAEGVAAFERVWYGKHDATAELAQWSMDQVGRLQSCVR